MFTKEEIALAKPCYEAIKKISKKNWEWKPEVGERFIYGHTSLGLIIGTRDKQWLLVHNHEYELHKDNGTPLLHWERIEKILEGMGYWLEVEKRAYAVFRREDSNCVVFITAKTRQLAVMQAVIELGKKE